MTIKLITYVRGFYPYIGQSKSLVCVAVFMVVRGGKLLKRSFSEINCYTQEFAMQYSELDAFMAGLSWISENIPDLDKQKLEIVFSGSARTKIKNDIEKSTTVNNYNRSDILQMLKNFGSVTFSAQGKIYSDDDDDTFNLYEFSNKVFEMYYGRDNGFMHQVYENASNNTIVLVGDPELRTRDERPIEEWS